MAKGATSRPSKNSASNPESKLEQQIFTADLAVGMFVSNLDRPWLDTPFLIQGFLIEDEETLLQLQQTCRHVTVDLDRSVLDGKDLLAPGAAPPNLAPPPPKFGPFCLP